MKTDSAVSKPVDRATESSLSPVAIAVGPEDRPPERRRRRRRIEAAIAAAVTLAGGIGIFLATRHAGEREAGATAVSAAPATQRGTETERATAPASAPNRKPGEVALAPGVAARNKIEVVPVRRAALAGDIHVIGNVSFSADHVAIVGPLVAGRIARLGAGIGSHVERGQVIAEVESADVGDARAALIAAGARMAAADANLRRERDLADKQISSVREREVAEAQSATERAARRAAEQRLRAIGLTTADIKAVDERDDGGRVPIRAPLSGTVIERLVTLGQAVERATDAFKIADLSKVWVLLDLYEKDLARVRPGLDVEVRTEALPGEVFRGRVAYVAPVIDQATRAATVRVEIDNRSRKLHIGQLVTATLIGSATSTAAPVLVVPVAALQRIEGKPTVFVKTEHGFERRAIELGISGRDQVEVRAGLAENESVAGQGAFLLKSELLR